MRTVIIREFGIAPISLDKGMAPRALTPGPWPNSGWELDMESIAHRPRDCARGPL